MKNSISNDKLQDVAIAASSELSQNGIHISESAREELAEVIGAFLTENCALNVVESESES